MSGDAPKIMQIADCIFIADQSTMLEKLLKNKQDWVCNGKIVLHE